MSTAHSRESAVLCQHIVREHFGPVVSRVAGQLLQRGRLSVREIARYLNMHSFGRRSTDALTQCPSHFGASPFAIETDSTKQRPLPTRLIQQALVILIQHNCVLHSSPAKAQDGAAPPAEEYFEADQDEILARMRFGTYQELMHQWGGRSAEAVIRYILYHGQVQAGAIVEHLSRHPDGRWTPPSGPQHEPRETPDEASVQRRAAKVRSLLVRMLDDAFVRPSTMVQHVSPQDRKMAYETSLRRTYKGVPTAKMLREIKIKVAAMVDKEDRKEYEGAEQGPDAPRLGFKRKAPQDAGRSKRQRKDDQGDASASHYVNGAAQTDELDIDVRVPEVKRVLTRQPDVWLRVNHDRFGIMIRNQVLVHAVARKYNATTGEVFRYMLQEDQQKDACSEREERSRPITLSALAHAVPSSAKIQRGLDRRSILAEEHGHAQDDGPTQTELLAEYVAILSSHDNVSSAAHATRFLAPFGSSTTTSAGGSTQVATSFTIEYSNLIRQLQVQMLRQMVVERFGPVAGRIFSILTEKGKLEEKHISKLGLIAMGETRDVCARLFAASLLSLQEIPKGNERNPQRTFFLWFVDLPKCCSWMLDHLYRTLAQLSERRMAEQEQNIGLLRKAERSDVKEDTVGLLAEWERRSLARLQGVLEAITVAEGRAQQDIFVLRHFTV